MKVKDVMSSPVITVDQHDTLWHVLQVFRANGFRHTVVTDLNDKAIGMLSETDLLRVVPMQPGEQLESQREALEKLQAQDIMQAVVNFRPEDDLSSLVQVFLTDRLDMAQVVDETRRPVGIVTITDVLRALMKLLTEKD